MEEQKKQEDKTDAQMPQQASQRMPSEGMPSRPQFRPLLISAHAAKGGRESRLSHAGVNFNLSSFLAYYPMLRLGGYIFEAGYSPITRFMQNSHLRGLQKIGGGHPEEMTFWQRAAQHVFPDHPLGIDKNPFVTGKGKPEENTNRAEDNAWFQSEGLKAVQPSDNLEGVDASEKYYEKTLTQTAPQYKRLLNRTEAGAFTALAAAHSYGAYNQLLANFKLAVGAELGKDPKNVNFLDLRKSNNPIVVSAVDRFMWQTPLRAAAGMAFIPGLAWGIIGNSAVITAERTIFYRPLSYDILSKAVNDVQINSLGNEAKGEVVDNLIRVMQAQRFDHRQAMIPREQVDAIRPTLELVADDIINKRFGISGLMYIMGGGVLIPEDPAQSKANYQHVREVGVSGVAEEAKRIRQETHVPSTKIWDARLLEGRREKDSDYVAESARRDELLRERRAILGRGPLHSMPGSEIDPSARYGSGVQLY